jgi:hypothetical protein
MKSVLAGKNSVSPDVKRSSICPLNLSTEANSLELASHFHTVSKQSLSYSLKLPFQLPQLYRGGIHRHM